MLNVNTIHELGPVLGIIAGNGTYPIEVAQSAKNQGLKIVVVAHKGETDSKIERLADSCVWIKVGELGRIIDVLSSAGAKKVVMAGGIRRIRLFGVKPDARALSLIARIGSFKDDAILRGIAAELAASGLELISGTQFLKNFSGQGFLGNQHFSAAMVKDGLIAWDAALAVGALDIGQTVIAHEGLVLAVEAIEGTDQAIKRAGSLCQGRGGVVVKLCKPMQDQRVDLPAVGPHTIVAIHKAGLRGLVIESEKSIILESERVVTLSNKLEIAVFAARDRQHLQGCLGAN